MTFKDIQERSWILINFYLFNIFFILAVFITNIYKQLFFYVIILFIVILINLFIWYKNHYIKIIFILFWLFIWFIISQQNNIKIWDIKTYINIFQTNNKNIEIIWTVEDKYKTDEFYNYYILKVTNLEWKKSKLNFNLIVKTNIKISFFKWDIIKFNSKIESINNFNEFWYNNYLLTKNIYWQTNLYQFSKIWNELNFYEIKIENFKNKLIKILNEIYPENSAKLLLWMFLWIRSEYSSELKKDLSNSWLSHIVAVSWYNITILIIFFTFLIRWFPLLIRNILITSIIIIFMLLLWINIPALRAWIMWIIGYLAKNYNKKVNIYSLLILILSCFLLINPLYINYDISLHLSFLAILWIILIQKPIENKLRFLPNVISLKETLSTTLSVLIFTIPILIINFNKISLVSIISNIIILPLIPFWMMFWWLSMIFYIISENIWIYIWYITYIIIEFILKIAHILWNINYTMIEIYIWENKIIFILYYYLLLFYLIINFKIKKEIENN